MAKFAGLRDPVTLDFENSTIAYCVDAFSISIGALMGTSPVTAYVESATGISGMCLSFCVLSSLTFAKTRGWKDRSHGYDYWHRLLRFHFLFADFCFDSLVGYWRCSDNCRFSYDPQVCRFLPTTVPIR